jgi:hypothetical protein
MGYPLSQKINHPDSNRARNAKDRPDSSFVDGLALCGLTKQVVQAGGAEHMPPLPRQATIPRPHRDSI